jgi:hypothetical protein
VTTHPGSPIASPIAPASSAGEPSKAFGALVLALSVAAIAWFFVVLVRDARAADYTLLDCRSSRVDFGPGWVDPRWEHQVALQLAQLPDLRADAPETREWITEALLELPFVAEVHSIRVLWPDGVRVRIKLRTPVACVRAGEQFLPLADDGVVLPGLWSAPPASKSGFLPLLALEDATRAEIVEGALLASTEVVDALAVAVAMERELAADDWLRLGRIVIDARRARLATVEEPGTVLWLEGGRRAYFGRSPNLDAPGELPVATKCASLAQALRLPESSEPLDWELADVRWDRPEVLPRGGLDRPRSRTGK